MEQEKKKKRTSRNLDSKKYQMNMVAILEDTETIIRNMKIRVDFLSLKGLMEADGAATLKKEGKISYKMGEVTAQRVLDLIKYDGELEWEEKNGCLDTCQRERE